MKLEIEKLGTVVKYAFSTGRKLNTLNYCRLHFALMIEKLWNDKDNQNNFIALRALVILYGVKYFAVFMRFLTKYPPFSYFWIDRFFHAKNMDIYETRKRIRELTEDIGGGFDVQAVDRDQYFLTLRGKFDILNKKDDLKEKYRQIRERLEKKDMILRVNSDGMMDVLIKRLS